MAMTTGMATSRPSASIDSLLKLEFENYNELLGHEGDDSSQLRVMELNLELEEEVSINALVVSRLTWTFCALLSCVVIRMSLTFFGIETPDTWWDKPMAMAAETLFSLWERVRNLVRNLGENLSALRAEVSKAAGDMMRGR